MWWVWWVWWGEERKRRRHVNVQPFDGHAERRYAEIIPVGIGAVLDHFEHCGGNTAAVSTHWVGVQLHRRHSGSDSAPRMCCFSSTHCRSGMACAHARWVGTGDGDVSEEAAVRTSPIDGQTRIRRLREGSGGQIRAESTTYFFFFGADS